MLINETAANQVFSLHRPLAAAVATRNPSLAVGDGSDSRPAENWGHERGEIGAERRLWLSRSAGLWVFSILRGDIRGFG